MSSRQEEKERRRQERLEREQAEARKAAARRRVQVVAGGVLGVAAVAAVVIAVAAGGGDDDGGTEPSGSSGTAVAIPAVAITDLDQAAKAAGCEIEEHENEGRDHISDSETFDGYKTNPPTSGTHRQTPAQDGIYETGNEPAAENLVHALEHGRIVLQYKPGTPVRRVSQLETLFNEKFRGVEGYHQLLVQNDTKMPYAVAASGWTRYIGCKEFTDKAFDALRAFREKYVDKGPELIP